MTQTYSTHALLVLLREGIYSQLGSQPPYQVLVNVHNFSDIDECISVSQEYDNKYRVMHDLHNRGPKAPR